MATECRAKNPNTCRMHGNPTISNLQAQADNAAVSGNVEEYLALRQQIDAAHDKSDLYHDSLVRAEVLQERVIESGARTCFDEMTGGGGYWPSQSRKTQDFFKEHVEAAFEAAEPYMDNGAETSNAVRAMQGALQEQFKETDVARFSYNSKPNGYWALTHAILKETRSLRHQLTAARRNVEDASK